MVWRELSEAKVIATETPIRLRHEVNGVKVANEGRYDILFEGDNGRRAVGDGLSVAKSIEAICLFGLISLDRFVVVR
jgi:hypothetical protein